MSRLSWVVGLAAMLLLTACRQQQRPLPPASARPYEVLVVGDVDSLVCHMLSVPMPALPQSEPMFDVRQVDSARFKGKLLLARNVVVVRWNRKWLGKPSLHIERDRHAQPQLIVNVDVGSANDLKQFIATNQQQVRQLLVTNEYLSAILQLQRKHSVRNERLIDSMFHHTVLLPADMTYNKVGKDFLWVSNNAAQGMQNLCVYTLSGIDDQPFERMDSVLRANIKGETDRMYMRTVARSMTQENVRFGGQSCRLQRGLWEMVGDAMAGPLVRRVVKDSVAGKTLVLDGFVYAPEMGKRNKMREMEAVLMTVKRK
ncbi:DUF4837 family protein [Prevotella sp. SGI.027]|nr:DUF4837 family protein [Prevotella sp.]